MSSTDVAAEAVTSDSVQRSEQSEAGIWILGGAWSCCLFLILGLLGLILWWGLPSFWPKPIHLVLSDPSSDDQLGCLLGQAQWQEQVQLVKEGQSTTRFCYRTGNAEVTGQQFEVIDASDQGILLTPSTAVLAECYQWGNVYGLPLQLSEVIRPSSGISEQLNALEDLLNLLSTVELIAPDPQTLQEVNRVLRLQGQRRLSENLRARIEALAKDNEREVVVRRLNEPQWQRWNEVGKQQIIVAAKVHWFGPNLMPRLEQPLEACREVTRQLRRKQEAIAELDHGISQLREEVLETEEAYESRLPIPLESVVPILNERIQLVRLLQQLEPLNELFEEFLSTEQDVVSENAVQLIKQFQREGILEARMSRIDEQLDAWNAQHLAEVPSRLAQAVRGFQQGYLHITAARIPLLAEHAELKRQLSQQHLGLAIAPGMKNSLTERPGSFASPATSISEEESRAAIKYPGTDVAQNLEERLREAGVLMARPLGHDPLDAKHYWTRVVDPEGVAQAAVVAYAEPPAASAWTAPAAVENITKFQLYEIAVSDIARLLQPNQLSTTHKFGYFFERWIEFVSTEPRRSSTAGGVFPAILGTVILTLTMTVAVVPFGVLAALYLHEYTQGGPLVSVIRISINNLASVPSIVYGVFGVAFFCNTLGAFIDGGPAAAGIPIWPAPVWFAAFALLAVLSLLAFFSGAISRRVALLRQSEEWSQRTALLLWLSCLFLLAILLLKSPFFEGFYAQDLPNPTYGKGGILWAALTLALLTLPIVIVTTEEALAAVPDSLRAGSLACGASKWQTIRNIVLPFARPGIVTGGILAMARGAGEVAPLMLVGAVTSAPNLPVDDQFPYIHFSQSFMHLGYEVYNLGFQSQNAEASKPLVFACALLLVLTVATLHLLANFLRAKSRIRYE